MKHTVNISRARAVGRNKRAKKAVSLLREKLEKIEDREVSISTPVNQEIWKRGATNPPRKVTVQVVEEGGEAVAVLADQPQREETTSETPSSEQEEEAEEQEDTASEAEEVEDEEADEDESETPSEEEYEEMLSGSVSDAKDEISEIEDPDYDLLIQLEEDGKDRKTMLDWLESQQ